MYCYTALPLDLHVLGLPLAFIRARIKLSIVNVLFELTNLLS